MASSNKLVERAIQGDVDALTTLLEVHGPVVRAAIVPEISQKWQSMLSVDDVMQQTYADAYLTIAGFENRHEDSFEAWLLTCARRNLLDAVRMLSARKRGGDHQRIEFRNEEESTAVLLEHLVGTDSTPSRHAARLEANAALREMIGRLSSNQRRVVRLYDIEGTSVDDVAKSLGKSVGAVFMLRARAHDRLRELMGAAHGYLSEKG